MIAARMFDVMTLALRIALTMAVLGGLLGCSHETAGHAIGRIHRADNTPFPDLSGYAEVDAYAYSTMDMRHYFFGPTFSTPDGQYCSSNERDYLHRLWCDGPRPDKGGYWLIAFSATTAATVEQVPAPNGRPDTDFKLVPAMHKIVVSGFTCGSDDKGMTACRSGDHGFVLTPTSTTLF